MDEKCKKFSHMGTSCCRLFGTVFCQHSYVGRNWSLAAVIVQGSHDCPSALVADLEEFIIFGYLILTLYCTKEH